MRWYLIAIGGLPGSRSGTGIVAEVADTARQLSWFTMVLALKLDVPSRPRCGVAATAASRRVPARGTVIPVATVEDAMKRRSLSVLAAVFALSGLTVLSAASPAYGYSCAETSIESVVDPGTVAAFVGVPVAVMESTGPGRDLGDVYVAPLVWTFEVETVIVGDLAETVEVGSGYGGGDCGFDFSHTGRVAVVAYGDPGNLTTGSCGGVWDAADFLAVHGPGVPPIPSVGAAAEPVDTGPPIWVWWGAAGLVLAAAAGVMISRRRTTYQDGWGEAGGD